jgi:hypothetical protein
MKIFKNNTWIDTSVYENWIEELNGCWIGIEKISSEHTESAYIFKNENFPSNSINTIDFIPNENEYIAVMSWGVVGEEIAIVKLEVKEQYRSRGIGQFFARLMWVWIIDNNDKIVRMPYTFRSDVAEHMIAKYAVEYNVPYAVLRTVDGEYATLEETPVDKVWGIQEGLINDEPESI